MEKPDFIKSEIEVGDVEEINGELAYKERIKELGKTGKLIKKLKNFSSVSDAEQYLRNRPSNVDSLLRRFIPETSYVIGQPEEGAGCTVYAIVKKVDGGRLDSLDLSRQGRDFYSQLDDFLASSLQYYEANGRTPGINLKNLVLGREGRLYYVDSEPFPETNLELFELARARKKRLVKLFGEGLQRFLPQTAQWIAENEVANYRKAKNLAKKGRRR